MKKIIGILLALVLFSVNAVSLAEAAGTSSVEEADAPGLLTCAESAIPFYPVQWGMKLKEVLEATGGEDMGNKADIRVPVSIPGIGDPVTAVFHCGKKGLESVSITVLDTVNVNVDYKDTDEGAAVFDCAEAFFSGIGSDRSARLELNCSGSRTYRNNYSDALIGYIEGEQGCRLMMEFYRPIGFDQKAFRNSNRFYMTTEGNGDILFFNEVKVMTGFDTAYSKDKRYERSMNVFASKIRLQGSNISPAFSVPQYGIVYAYAGTVKPADAITMIFTVDGTMYQFTDIPATSLSVTQYKEYSQQYTIWMCGTNSAFMEALEKSKKTVNVELRGTGFSLLFEMPQKAKSGLVTDWKAYKKANGTDPGLLRMLESLRTPMTVY